MSLRRPSLLVVLLLAASSWSGVSVAAEGGATRIATDPAAYLGPDVCVSSEVRGAVGEVCARRRAFGAEWVLQVSSNEFEGPVEATINLEVADGRDPSASLRNDAGAGTRSDRSGTFSPRSGRAIGDIAITTCIDVSFGPDDCETNSATLPQLVSRASAAQAARLEQLVFDEPLEAFMAIREAEPREGVDADFDWRSDGCSAGPLAPVVNARLRAACVRHDFGYRNYGQLLFGPTDSMRRRVDEQLEIDAIALGQAGLGAAMREAVQRFAAPVFHGDDLQTAWLVPSFLAEWLRTDDDDYP